MKASGCEVELSRNRFTNQEAFVSHANAVLTPRARLRLAELIVDRGWTYAAAAKMFMVAPRTAKNGPTASASKVRSEWLTAARVHAVVPTGPGPRSCGPAASHPTDQPPWTSQLVVAAP